MKLGTRWQAVAKSQRIFIALFALYLAGQVICLLQITLHYPNGFSTENFYSPLAAYLASHGWTGLVSYIEGTIPDIFSFGPAFRPPLFSLTLTGIYALFGEREIYGLVLNNVFLAATILLVHLIGRRITSTVGLVAPILMMLDPIFLAAANRNESEAMFMFLVMSSIYAMVLGVQRERPSYRLIALSSSCLLLAVFTRNAGLYIWVAMAAALFATYWLKRDRDVTFKVLLVFLAIQLIPIGGWMARNYSINGDPDFAGGEGGFALALYYVPHIHSMRDGGSSDAKQAEIIREISSIPGFSSMTPFERNQLYSEYAIKEISANLLWATAVIIDHIPKLYLSYPFEVFAAFSTKEQLERWEEFDRIQYTKTFDRSNLEISEKLNVAQFFWDNGMVFAIVYGFFSKFLNGIVLILGVIGFYTMITRANSSLRSVGIILLSYFALASLIALFFASARFRVPITPVLFLSAAFGVQTILNTSTAGRLLRTAVREER